MKVVPYTPDRAQAWQSFVEQSLNGTLFHTHAFLSYHPPDRFVTDHLMVYGGDDLLAVLPAARHDGILRSPYGASVGGPAISSDTPVVEVLHALQAYARCDIEFNLPPLFYMADDRLGWGMQRAGFTLARRLLVHAVPLHQQTLSPGKVRDVRQNLNKGLQPRRVGLDRLPLFYDMLEETRLRQGTRPTHTEAELRDLMTRLEEAVWLFSCRHGDEEIAGVLVFVLNRRIAYTMYICQRDAYKQLCGTAVLLAHISDVCRAAGMQWLDLGPSEFEDGAINEGLERFKTGMGGRPWCRDRWRYSHPQA